MTDRETRQRDANPGESKPGDPPRRRTWPAFAIVGFVGGVMTVIFLAWLWNHVLH